MGRPIAQSDFILKHNIILEVKIQGHSDRSPISCNGDEYVNIDMKLYGGS